MLNNLQHAPSPHLHLTPLLRSSSVKQHCGLHVSRRIYNPTSASFHTSIPKTQAPYTSTHHVNNRHNNTRSPSLTRKTSKHVVSSPSRFFSTRLHTSTRHSTSSHLPPQLRFLSHPFSTFVPRTSASFSKNDESLTALPLPSIRDKIEYLFVELYKHLVYNKPPAGFERFADDDSGNKNASTPKSSKPNSSNKTPSPPDKKNKNVNKKQETNSVVDNESTDSEKLHASQTQANTGGNKNVDPNKQPNEKESDQHHEAFDEWSKTKKESDKHHDDSKHTTAPPALPGPSLGLLLVVGIVVAYAYFDSVSYGEEITWQDFKTRFLEMGKVHHLDVNSKDKRVRVYLRNDNGDVDHSARYYFNVGSIDTFERQLEDAQHDLDVDQRDYIPVKYHVESAWAPVLGTVLQYAIFFGFLYWVTKNLSNMVSGGGISGSSKGGGGVGGIFRIGKSNATMMKPGEYTKVTFADVAGLDEAKMEVMEFVKFLKNPEKFTKLGAIVPKGALLVGPPGTGKTLLAKAVAGEASVPFFSISGSDFIEMFVGVGPSRVRDLFADARKNAPCIIFIDEIDAVGRERGRGKFAGGNDERENTLNQLLVEMDGFNDREGIVVLAGTNRRDILDKALLRPGRFDRQITVDKPDLRGRAQIFLVHLKKIKTQHDKNDLAARLAALTPGFVGADIANLCNEAAIIAARFDKEYVELVDFESAADRVIGGLEKRNSAMSQLERKLVAYHEAGHAAVGWFLEHADPLLKVTIVPRGSGALGFAQYLPNELHLYQQDQLADMMVMTLAGRASELEFFGKISTGASDDLQKVSRVAQAQVSLYGMSARLGHVAYERTDDEQGFVKPFSEATAQAIDEEIRAMVAVAFQRAREMIQLHKEKVEALAQRLLQVETVNHDVLIEVLGPRPYQNEAYKRYSESVDQTKRDMLKKKAESAKAGKTTKKSDEDATSVDDNHAQPAVQL